MYDPVLARYYHETHRQLSDDIPFLVKMAQESGGPTLELGCGTGRLLLPLGRAGCHVVGVDNASAMLAIAAQALVAEPPAVQTYLKLVQADMTRLGFVTGHFQLAVVPYNTLLHLDDAAFLRLLHSLRRVLAAGGRLLIDTLNPHMLINTPDEREPIYEQTFVDPHTQSRVDQYSSNWLEPAAQRFYLSWLFAVTAADGTFSRHVSTDAYHYRFPHQLQLHLGQAGFEVLNIWGGYGQEAFDEECERLIVWARRR